MNRKELQTKLERAEADVRDVRQQLADMGRDNIVRPGDFVYHKGSLADFRKRIVITCKTYRRLSKSWEVDDRSIPLIDYETGQRNSGGFDLYTTGDGRKVTGFQDDV